MRRHGVWAAVAVAAVTTLVLLASRASGQEPAPRSVALTPGVWRYTAELDPAPTGADVQRFAEALDSAGGSLVAHEVRDGRLLFQFRQPVLVAQVVTLPMEFELHGAGEPFRVRVVSIEKAGSFA